jgi:hypothetical protein
MLETFGLPNFVWGSNLFVHTKLPLVTMTQPKAFDVVMPDLELPKESYSIRASTSDQPHFHSTHLILFIYCLWQMTKNCFPKTSSPSCRITTTTYGWSWKTFPATFFGMLNCCFSFDKMTITSSPSTPDIIRCLPHNIYTHSASDGFPFLFTSTLSIGGASIRHSLAQGHIRGGITETSRDRKKVFHWEIKSLGMFGSAFVPTSCATWPSTCPCESLHNAQEWPMHIQTRWSERISTPQTMVILSSQIHVFFGATHVSVYPQQFRGSA